ncbi:MAG: bifunctional YncE family protein/alkaline phosphatase family protein [Deltaproteobacteria bacterium]|nr:bifunctional YncE family protein/alkaline phosphatase family protein [Deltaproteobacteria bacterium]MBI3386355.1 bifunctional YncE family protein/alkaline phosphatase family protein [Deltaproteobacteria bacterium]
MPLSQSFRPLVTMLGITLLLAALPARAHGALCVGDCNDDGEVTVEELVYGVNLALGSGGALRLCRPLDANGDHLVTVEELVRAVNVALATCPASIEVYRAPAGEAVAGPQSSASGVLPNGRRVEPMGEQVPIDTFPLNLALTPDEAHVIVTNDGFGNDNFQRNLQVIETASRTVSRVPVPHYLGLALSPDGEQVFVPNGTLNTVQRLRFEHGELQPPEVVATLADGTFPTGLTVSHDGRYLYVVGLRSNALWTVDLQTGETMHGPDFGNFPYSVKLAADGQHAFVTSWGLNNGNPSGLIPAPLPPFDPNGFSRSSVIVVDLSNPTQPRLQKSIPIGRSAHIDNRTVFGGSHPTAMTLSPDGALLYVTATNLDSLAVIDTATFTLATELQLNRFDSGGASLGLQGLYPDAVTVSADGRRIYVADAGINAVQVIAADPAARTFQSLGFIPTGWYPSALALTHDGTRLYVANAKGVGVGGNGAELIDISDENLGATPYYIGRIIKGSVSIIDGVDHVDLDAGTATVRALNGFDPVTVQRVDGHAGDGDLEHGHPLPPDFGSSASQQIKHVVFILKENRTYDQVFGDLDLPGASRDSRLTLFGDDVTPNHHALARQFATGDNFYCDAEVSIPGHEWTDQGNDTDWTEKTWPFNYNGGGISDAMAQTGQEGFSKAGYIFELMDREQVPFRVYGEAFALLSRLEAGKNGGGVQGLFSKLVQAAGSVSNLAANAGLIFAGDVAALSAAGINVDILKNEVWPNFKLDYPSNILPDKTDVQRARLFIDELDQYTTSGELPQFLFIWLPNDHTFGATPNMPTPRAAVADNDRGLGMVIDALSHSPFWNDMAIFISEDDAQDAQDHVSAHRTIDLAIGPYIKHGFLSHVHHSNVSMLKTMELLLGVGPQSQYDRYTTDMRDYFTTTPDFTPYTALSSAVAAEVNPSAVDAGNAYLREAAEVSSGLNLSDYDEAGPELSRVLWLAHVGERFEREKHLAVMLTLAFVTLLILGGAAMQRKRSMVSGL